MTEEGRGLLYRSGEGNRPSATFKPQEGTEIPSHSTTGIGQLTSLTKFHNNAIPRFTLGGLSKNVSICFKTVLNNFIREDIKLNRSFLRLSRQVFKIPLLIGFVFLSLSNLINLFNRWSLDQDQLNRYIYFKNNLKLNSIPPFRLLLL